MRPARQVALRLLGGAMVTPTVVGGAANGAPPTGPVLDGTARIVAVGNSFTQQYTVTGAIAHYVNARLDDASITVGPPPVLPGTISGSSTSGYYPRMTLAGMTLFPAYDQRYGSGLGGTEDALDAIASQPANTWDYVMLTSGFRQSDPTEPEEVVPGDTRPVALQAARDVAAELGSRLTPAPVAIIRMTHEGFVANGDPDLTSVEAYIQDQVAGARQLESEGWLVVPEHYVRGRLQYGAFGPVGSALTDPVPAYATLTHSTSAQPGNRNYGWLSRTQGTTAPFPWNSHQNVISSIVAAWTWGYWMWGIDPRGDTTFASPVGLPHPIDDFISPDGSLIYGGHATGIGNRPFDVAVNPSGPPDSEFVLDWSSTTQAQIQARIVAAIDDWRAGTTEFD